MNAVRTRKNTFTRALAIAAGGAAALLALTGCLSINADVSINSDAKGTGTFAISLQKQAAKLMGIEDLATFKDGIKQGTTPGAGNMLNNAKCDPSETSDSFVLTCTFTNAEFTKPDELWTITKANNEIVFAMKNSPSAGAGADTSQMTDLLGGGSLGDVTINLTFPGPISSVTGAGATQNSDTTATVKGTMTDSFDVTITSKTSSSLPWVWIIIAIVGLAILALIVVALIIFLVRRSRRNQVSSDQGAVAVAGPAEQLPVAGAAEGADAATTTVVETVTETPTEIVETVTETPTEIVETVTETPTEIVETVTETPTEIVETVTEHTDPPAPV